MIARLGNRLAFAIASLLLVHSMAFAAENAGAENAPVDFAALRRSERTVDSRIERYRPEQPLEVIGATRAVYLTGTGLVFSMEVSLSPAVGISPFFTKMPASEVDKIHAAKTRRVPVLRELLLSMMPEIAKAHPGVPDGEDLVLGATLFYFPYEKRDGLPNQIVIRAKAGALRKVAGSVSEDAARVEPLAKVKIY